MAKKRAKKQFRVEFKSFNLKLKATKKQLEKIQKKVIKKDQKTIARQIRAIKVLLGPCNPINIGHPPMSALYTGK